MIGPLGSRPSSHLVDYSLDESLVAEHHDFDVRVLVAPRAVAGPLIRSPSMGSSTTSVPREVLPHTLVGGEMDLVLRRSRADGLRMGESAWPLSSARVGDLPCEYDEAGWSLSDEIQEGPVGFDR